MNIDLPRVPLEAGAGPDNPPCPACSEPLFPWVGMPVSTGIAHRCEACGLAVLGHGEKFHFPKRAGESDPTEEEATEKDPASFEPGSQAEALAELNKLRDESGSISFDNRASFACSLVGGAWVGLGSDSRYLFTPESITDLVAAQDQTVTKVRWRPLRGIALMWQSGVNMFTFGQNVVLGSMGKADAIPAKESWKRVLDWFISAAVAIPAIIFAAPVELIAVACRKGAAAVAETRAP